MTGNRSLDEFLGADDEAAEEAVEASTGAAVEESARDAPEESAEGDREPHGTADAARAEAPVPDDADESTPVDPDDVEPMAATYAWSDPGAACAACGATVEVRWRDEAGLVCVDCKAW